LEKLCNAPSRKRSGRFFVGLAGHRACPVLAPNSSPLHIGFIGPRDLRHPMKTPSMKKGPALFVQVVIVLVGIGTLGWLLWEPHLEGRNAHATIFEIYFKDPFLAYVYAGSIPFFMALHRAFGLFGDVRRKGTFSPATLTALHTIKRCATAIIGFVAGGEIFILMFGDRDDRPAGIFMSVLVAFAASVIATAAAIFARNLRNALRRAEGHQA
jgi:hypothetical protein